MQRRYTAPRLVVCSILLSLLATTVEAAATHHHRGTATVDGVESPAEWAGASAGSADMTLPPGLGGGGGPVTFNIMNDDANLYVSMRFPYSASPPSPSYLVMLVQSWEDGTVICGPSTFDDDFWLFAENGGASFSDRFNPECTGDAPDDSDGGTSDGAAAMSDEGATLYFEISHPLDTADNLHDRSSAVSRWLLMAVNSTGCDASECGSAAHLIRRVYLEPANYVFVGDFETQDTSEWSAVAP